MSDSTFNSWFAHVTDHESPRSWQGELAATSTCRDRLIRIPTGLGKTEGILAAWSYHRLHRADAHWPRRLIWCLPMRVLVEQTEQVARRLAESIPDAHRPKVHVAMGGEDAAEWFLCPERPAIIIGTQDMLLSRALNRGYASARARWPMEFGLLNHDALWVMDEVQLMDVGLATSAQLQAFREEDRERGLRPCHTWWMSATLQPEWLKSVDTEGYHATWVREPCIVAPAQRGGGLWDIHKSLATASIDLDDAGAFARRILAEHAELSAVDFGRITLVVCNTVRRACQIYDVLREMGRTEGLELVHSRFRPAEREGWRERFLSRSGCAPEVDRIIVATQVVEAGVDISAGSLITELAPWPSLVQRFGRCARYGGSGKVLVIDRWMPKTRDKKSSKPERADERDKMSSAPYQPEELNAAWEALQQLKVKGVGISSLEDHEDELKKNRPEQLKGLYPYSPSHLLLRREFDELFDTTPDLTGADLDISRFIRSGDERDLQVFWIELAKGESPPAQRHPHRQELCTVPFLEARDWLCGEETKTNRKPKLRSDMRAWVWDWIDGEWAEATRASLLPGRVVGVAAACGGYRTDRSFDPESKEAVTPVPRPIPSETQVLAEADDQQDGEIPGNRWKTIACHTAEVASKAGEIARELGLPKHLQEILDLAAFWHDWGKSHPAFQGAMRGADRPARCDLAKGPEGAWRKPPDMYKYLDDGEIRPAFRHELASALGLFAILQAYAPQHQALLGPWSEVLAKLGKSPVSGEPPPTPSPLIQRVVDCSPEAFDLLVYLVASHHGKVRVALHAAPKDQEYRDRDGRGLPIRGIREGDRLPSVALIPGQPAISEVTLTLSPAAIGLSERTGISWRERCLGVIERYGPAGLAFLEAILRAADVRASRLKTNDPALASEANA
ncbi:MAG: CRISPR-associated helicase Cas3' [Planctomycetes bacterium]|nr:CRISPR-associated helicase Cas3' [Planctomycetota bacterium]